MSSYNLIIFEDCKSVAERRFLGSTFPRVGETLTIKPVKNLDQIVLNDFERAISLINANSKRRKRSFEVRKETYTKSEFRQRLLEAVEFHNKFAGEYSVFDIEHPADLFFHVDQALTEYVSKDLPIASYMPDFVETVIALADRLSYLSIHVRQCIPSVKIRKK